MKEEKLNALGAPEQSAVKGRHHIYTGFREGSTLRNALQAGEAYEVEMPSGPFYIVKMWSFPRDIFYLSKNRSENGNFTLFAKMIMEQNKPAFRRPVGFGLISDHLNKHLEIQFTFPRQRVFMSLFPDAVTIDSLFGPNGGVGA